MLEIIHVMCAKTQTQSNKMRKQVIIFRWNKTENNAIKVITVTLDGYQNANMYSVWHLGML